MRAGHGTARANSTWAATVIPGIGVARRRLGADKEPSGSQEDEMIGFVALGIVMLLWILTWETWDSPEDPADAPAAVQGAERSVQP
jgi:hypothetical protein